MGRRALVAAAAFVLAACAPVAPLPPAIPAPATAATGYQLPAARADWYRVAAATGATVLTIDAAQSLIVVTVRRGGALARLGHDHVVASHAVTGMTSPAAGRADAGFLLDQLVVDEAPLRDAARLDTQPTPDAIAGTRLNMLTRVLEAERYPEVTLTVETAPVALPLAEKRTQAAQLSITLHGVTRVLPVQLTLAPVPGGLVASGTLSLRQSDFGITPMSIINGAMTVQDELALEYRLFALAN